MFGMGMGEIVLIAVVALLVLGPERLPSAARAIGKGIRDLRSQTKDLQQTIEKDTQLGDAVRELRGALRGDPETLYERATGQRFSDVVDSTGKATKDPQLGDAGEPAAVLADGGATEASDDGDASVDTSLAAESAPISPPSEHAIDSDEPVIRSAPGAVARTGITADDDLDHG